MFQDLVTSEFGRRDYANGVSQHHTKKEMRIKSLATSTEKPREDKVSKIVNYYYDSRKSGEWNIVMRAKQYTSTREDLSRKPDLFADGVYWLLEWNYLCAVVGVTGQICWIPEKDKPMGRIEQSRNQFLNDSPDAASVDHPTINCDLHLVVLVQHGSELGLPK